MSQNIRKAVLHNILLQKYITFFRFYGRFGDQFKFDL